MAPPLPAIEYFPDYHEHIDFQPAMLAFSHFLLQWNWAEHNFNVVLWQHAGDMQIGAMYTAGLGNQSRADALLALVRKHEKNSKVVELTEFAVKAFSRIKANRNSLAHAHSIYSDSEMAKPKWIRASNNPKNLHIYCLADINDITENLNAACKLSLILSELIIYYTTPEKPVPSLEIFTLPDLLTPIPVDIEAPE